MTVGGAPGRRSRRDDGRSSWTLPLVIILVIVVVAIVDHLGAHRISEVDQAPAPSLVATSGGSMTVDLDQPWSGFNPNTTAGAASSTPALLTPVLPSAFIVDPQLQPELNSDLLQSVEVTDTDPLTIVYVINPKAVWSDGVPVSAADFIYAWEAQRGDGTDIDHQPYDAASNLGYRDVNSVTGSPDGKTVTVVFANPFGDWRTLFSGMVPAHVAEAVGWNHGFDSFDPARDLSAGPLLVQSVSGDSAVLVPNPRWWSTPPSFGKVVVNASPSADWSGDLAGGGRAAVTRSSFDLASLSSLTSLPNVQSAVGASVQMLQLDFAVQSPAVSSATVRQAVAHAVDRNAIVTSVFGTLTTEPAVPDDHLTVNSQMWYQASTAAVGYDAPDPEATEHLLVSAGYHRGPDGAFVDGTGKPLVLRLAVESGDPWIHAVADQIVDQLHQAGIGVTEEDVDGVSGLAAAAELHAYDMALVTRTAGPYLSVTQGWYSLGLGPVGKNGSADWSGFDDPQVDQLFAEAEVELNPLNSGAVYGQIDDQLWDQMVGLPIVQEPVLSAHDVQISGVVPNPSINGTLWNVGTWKPLVPGPTSS